MFKLRSFKKGECLVQSGERMKEVGYVFQGIWRGYYQNNEGKEFISSFYLENDFFVPRVDERREVLPSPLTIECLEDSWVLVASLRNFISLYERHHCWERFGRKLLEHYYALKLKREEQLLQREGIERYQEFINEFPSLQKRVPQYLIASYIGVAPQSLSRMIKRQQRPSKGY